MKCIFLFISTFIISSCQAQLKNPDERTFTPQFDMKFAGGVSIPLGKYQLLTDISDDRSAAGHGMYSELSGSITPLSSSPWRIGLTIGYMYQPFKAEESKVYYDLFSLEGSPWNSFYGLFGIGFTSSSKLFYSIQASAGIVVYSGGNIVSGTNTLDTIRLRTWVYQANASGAVQASFSLGYHFTPKFSMFVNVALFYAAGLRMGSLLDERFTIDAQNRLQQPALGQKSKIVQNQSTIFTLNLGLGIRYKFYETKKINYQFNIEKNQ